MKKRRLFAVVSAAVICLSCLAFPAFAVDNSLEPYVVTLYNDSNGLPTGEANDVLQTSDGYIWIGSYGGLIRYDGSSFRNFSLEGAISSSSIRALAESSDKKLWIGTNDAGVFVMENGTITHIPCEDEKSFLCIRDFAVAPDGTVYVASNSGIAAVRDGVLTPVSGEHAVGATIYSVDVDSLGRVWGSLNGGTCVMIENGIETQTFTSSEFFPDGESVYCTGSDDQGNIWLGTSGSVLAKLTPKGSDDFEVSITETPGVTTHNMIKTGPDGSVIVCGNVGACVILSSGEQIAFSEIDHAVSLNSGCMDYEGNVWLASTSYGIIKYTAGCFESPNYKAGLNGIPLNAVVKQGGYYFLATDSGILAYDGDWNPVQNSLTEAYDEIRARCFATDDEGNVWVATYDTHKSVACYNPETDSLTTFGTAEGLLSSGARTVYKLSDGSIAVGTQMGLNIIKDGAVTASYGSAEGLTTTSVLCTVETKDGAILVGSDGGGIYEIKNGTVTNHSFAEGLSDGVVLRILEDSEEDGYFISAGSSLYYMDAEGFKKIDIKKGAGSVFDFYLKDGKLWILQNNGILSYDRAALLAGEDVTPKEYGSQHGLSGSLNANTWNWTDPQSGSLYLATRSGISIFNFGGVENVPPKAIINSLYVDGNEIVNPTQAVLKSDVSRITLDFSALTYTGTTDVVIEYILEGFDEEPTVVNGLKTTNVSYTNLPGGDYTFRLKVYTPGSESRAAICCIPITKEKHFYEHIAFIIAVAVATVGLIVGVVIIAERARLAAAEKRQKEYRHIVVQSLQTFARAIDAKDKYTNGHSLRVAEYSAQLAKRMGLSEKEQENIYYIALLHDIGKIGIPDSILNKPGKLTDEERKVIQNHPLIGGEILKDFTAIEGIADGAKFHHERIDGKGYNNGLKGNEIPLIARIIGVADTYDAMSSTRCYRPSLTKEFIVEELKRVAGTQLDANIVPYMLDMIADGSAPLAEDAHKEAKDIGQHYKT